MAGIGENRYVEYLYALVARKKRTDVISFVGPRFGVEKQDLYHSADVFVLPTYSDNFGVVLIEAMASGLPVITTAAADLSGAIQAAGVRIVENHVEQLTDAMKSLRLSTD